MMKRAMLGFFCILCGWQSLAVQAQPALASPCAQVKGRPCVALVLGGGGARGGAHVGVLRQLEAQQVPIDLIVGTSIGAFVGGLYATGHSPTEIEHILKTLDWGAGFTDRVARPEMPLRKREQRDNYGIRLDLGLSRTGVKLPQGLLLGQAMAELIQEAYGVQPSSMHFDQLPVPFRAIATNLRNQETVVLSQGSLLSAVQASMSIPGVVQPVRLEQKILVDGGVANNLPISVAKALGADRVIAVAIDAPLQAEEQLNSAFAVTEQLTSFLVLAEVARQKALLSSQDVLLEPQIHTIATLSFEEMPAAIQAGHVVATAHQQQLSTFSQPEVYAQWQHRQRQGMTGQSHISQVTLNNESALSDDLVLERLAIEPGRYYSSSELSEAIHRVYGLDQFERISHQLKPLPDGTDALELQLKAKSWGPGFVNFNLLLDDDFRSNRTVVFGGSYLYTGLSPYGAEWYNEVAIGTDKLFSTELYWPLGLSQTFVAAKARHVIGHLSLTDQQGLSLGDFNRRQTHLETRVGYEFSDDARLSAAFLDIDGRYQLPTFWAQSLGRPYLHFARQGPELSLHFDSLDHLTFPRQGWKLQLHRQWLNDRFMESASESINTSLEFIAATSAGSHAFKTRWLAQSYRSAAGNIPLEQFSLGGLLNLSGYPRNYLYSSGVRFGSLVYSYKVHENRFSFFQSPFYLGGSLERGWVKDSVWQPLPGAPAQWIWAGSVFLGWESPFGTVMLGYGQAEPTYSEQNQQFYLSIGQWH